MILTFEIFGRARNHGKKFLKLCQTSFSGIVHCGAHFIRKVFSQKIWNLYFRNLPERSRRQQIVKKRCCLREKIINAFSPLKAKTRGYLLVIEKTLVISKINLVSVKQSSITKSHRRIKAVTSCSTHKIDQQETDG